MRTWLNMQLQIVQPLPCTCAAFIADLPVVISVPLLSPPWILAASMYNVEPPIEVHANPMTTPGGVVS